MQLLPSEECLDLIRTYEGIRLQAYRCPAGVVTIGYGSTGSDISMGMVWTLDQAKARLARDVTKFSNGVAKLAPQCTQGQFDGLVSFAYNCGLEALRGSTLLRLHNAGNHAGAAAQFSKWVKAAGKILPGLVRRRQAEASLYLS